MDKTSKIITNTDIFVPEPHAPEKVKSNQTSVPKATKFAVITETMHRTANTEMGDNLTDGGALQPGASWVGVGDTSAKGELERASASGRAACGQGSEPPDSLRPPELIPAVPPPLPALHPPHLSDVCS